MDIPVMYDGQEVNLMSEAKLLDMIILERISALLATQSKSSEKKQMKFKLIFQAKKSYKIYRSQIVKYCPSTLIL